MMTGILEQIDAAIDGLCPCGAEPRPGSAYCGDDCVPNWRGEHTISDVDGTAMRWRPDLVTEADDTGLRLLEGECNGYTGRHHAAVYERTPDLWHFRLDDGYRFVGLDVDVTRDGEVLDGAFVARVRDAWQRLEQELGNVAHVERDPWADITRSLSSPAYYRIPSSGDRQRICDWLRANGLDPNVIPNGSPIRLTRESITVEVMRHDERGNVVLVNNEVATDPCTVPLAEAWPLDLHYDGLVADELASWSVPPGSLYDSLVQAQAEAVLRARAEELATRSARSGVAVQFNTESGSQSALWRFYGSYVVGLSVSDPRSIMRISSA